MTLQISYQRWPAAHRQLRSEAQMLPSCFDCFWSVAIDQAHIILQRYVREGMGTPREVHFAPECYETILGESDIPQNVGISSLISTYPADVVVKGR